MTYRCPTCTSTDDTAYVRCQHPMCPDGRDQGVRTEAPAEKPRKPFNWDRLWCVLFGACLVAQAWTMIGNHHLEDRLSTTRELLSKTRGICEGIGIVMKDD